MTTLLALFAWPLITAVVGLGAVPAAPPPIATIPPVIHLSLVGGGVEAGQHLQVQAVVTGVGGIREQGTVTFWIAGSSMKVGSVLDATSTAVANLGFVTTGPTIVDASFVPAGSSVQAATAEATFRASPISVTPFVTVDPAVAGSAVPVRFGLNLGPSGHAPNGHVDVMIGVATVRSAFCVLVPGGATSVAGVWQCTATIPSLPAGKVELHVVLADSPYYASSTYLVVPVAAAPLAAPSPKTSAAAAPTAGPTSAASGSAPPRADSTNSASSAAEPGAASGASADGIPAASASPNWIGIVPVIIVLVALIGAALLVLRRIRRPADPNDP